MAMGFAILLVCQLAGEVVSRGFGLPVPGPVLGLVLLMMGLLVWGRGRDDAAIASSAVARVSDGLLAHLALLFVPAGVGVVEYGRPPQGRGPAARRGPPGIDRDHPRRDGACIRRRGPPASARLGRSQTRRGRHVSVFGLWVYLSTTPLFWLTVTLLVWLVADGLARLSRPQPAGQSGDDLRRDRRDPAGRVGDALPGLFRGRPVHPLPARPRHGGARRAALPQPRARGPQPPAHGGSARRRSRRGHGLGARHSSRPRSATRRAGLAGAQIRDGGRSPWRWRSGSVASRR